MSDKVLLEKALYIVPTPIGNLKDITLRAIDVLQNADVIAAEDTRHSKILLDNLSIQPKKLISCHDHNEEQRANLFANIINEGQTIALISDAGTPLISDPGFKVVRFLAKQNIRVIPLPGACAAITALSASGLATDNFHFAGFLPVKEQELKATIESLKDLPFVNIFYESPRRILNSIKVIAEVMPQRQIVLCRELTKTFENIYRMSASSLYDFLLEDANRQKGEFVLIVDRKEAEEQGIISDKVLNTLRMLLDKMSLKDACKIASSIYDLNKNVLYKEALLLKEFYK